MGVCRAPVARALFTMPVAVQGSPGESFAAGRAWELDASLQEDDPSDGLHLHQRVINWRLDSVGAARIDAHQCLAELRRDQASLVDLRNELASAAQLKLIASEQKAENQRLLELERRYRATVTTRVKEANQTIAKLRDQQESRLRELDHVEGTIADQRRTAAARMAKVNAFLALFSERLGLSIARIAPQTVRVSFALIDDTDPDRQFSFTLGLASPTAYTVTDCSVKLPNLHELVDRLNSDYDSPSALPTFTCSMRRAFKQVALER